MVVPDALADKRFAKNPLVTDDPKIRFYAGAPLVTAQGAALGTVCAIDRKPGKLKPEQIAALQALSREVMALLEIRCLAAELDQKVQTQTVELAGTIEKLRAEIDMRQQADRRLNVQYAVTAALSDCAGRAEAATKIVQPIGEAMGWDVGSIWMRVPGTEELRCDGQWHVPGYNIAPFSERSRQISISGATSLLGLTSQTGKPQWRADISRESNFIRAAEAAQVGLHGACAFPIKYAGETIGVIEFFSRVLGEPDEEMFLLMDSLGKQIGNFFHRMRAEEELSASEAKYRQLWETTTDVVITLDTEQHIEFANPAIKNVFGYEPQEVEGKDISLLQPERLRAVHRAGVERYLESGRRTLNWRATETLGLHKDGREIPIEIAFSDMALEGRRRFVAFIRDVTERKLAQETLARREEHYRRLIENSADVITILDIAGTIRYESPSVERVLGYKPEELSGKFAFDLVHSDDRPRLLDVFNGAIQTRELSAPLEVRCRHKDGSWRVLEGMVQNFLDDPAVQGVVVNSRDITQRKQAEAQVELMNRLKGYFSPQVAEAILKTEGAASLLQTRRKEITAVFTDLRGFTAFSEGNEPEEVMDLLRDYHAQMGKLIFKYEGTLEHFAGDGLLVFFNDPIAFDDHIERAVRMALEMRDKIHELRSGWLKRGYDLHLGLGLAAGYATLGDIGFEDRREYAAIGSLVNLASRLCSEAKGGQIVTEQKTLGRLEGRAEVEPLGELQLKGFIRPVQAFNILKLKP